MPMGLQGSTDSLPIIIIIIIVIVVHELHATTSTSRSSQRDKLVEQQRDILMVCHLCCGSSAYRSTDTTLL
jgi:hypothetical protein